MYCISKLTVIFGVLDTKCFQVHLLPSLDQRFSLAAYNYSLWNQFPNQRTVQLANSVIESHLDSLKGGSKKALMLFPNLLSFIEEISSSEIDRQTYSSVLAKFTSKSLDVPPWLFVPWINQILSMVGGCFDEVGRALGPLLLG